MWLRRSSFNECIPSFSSCFHWNQPTSSPIRQSSISPERPLPGALFNFDESRSRSHKRHAWGGKPGNDDRLDLVRQRAKGIGSTQPLRDSQLTTGLEGETWFCVLGSACRGGRPWERETKLSHRLSLEQPQPCRRQKRVWETTTGGSNGVARVGECITRRMMDHEVFLVSNHLHPAALSRHTPTHVFGVAFQCEPVVASIPDRNAPILM